MLVHILLAGVDEDSVLSHQVKYLSINAGSIEALVNKKQNRYFDGRPVTRDELDDKTISFEDGYRFDFALSFSGSQRKEARDLASVLKGRGADVFFDEDETSSIVGQNLSETLYEVYNSGSTFCVILVSEQYRNSPWTNQERRAALDRAIAKFNDAYILHIRIDNTDLPGLSRSVSYLKWELGAIEIARILYEKLVLGMVAANTRISQQH